ncbi:amino acid adenylation domain-containing protein [Streptomyces sp. NBC_00846]|uniref:amino acid adenylation domain-containing protein n=1 Tax=Streptomyces sp. NBC_00846 TaxID=2975849 RepID=UPI003866F256|nr:amino acid adenylation domain-containing protein [Streptomyces sp. NBC_00846]
MAEDIQALRDHILRSRLEGTGTSAVHTTPTADRGASVPLSPSQRRLWFLDSINPDSGEYHVPMVLRLRGAVDVPALQQAWARVLERHEVLRTRYRMERDEPVQEVTDSPENAMVHSDLREAAAEDRESRARELVQRLAHSPMSLAEGRVARAGLVTVAEDDHYLVVSIHHIAFDAWSEPILWRDLALAYQAERGDGSVEFPPLPMQYADYSEWQRTRLLDGTLAESHAFWKRQLSGITPLELPTDRPRQAVRSSAGASLPITVPPAVAKAVRAAAAEHDTTPFVVLLTAFQMLLNRYTGQQDIAVGVPVAGRDERATQELIGCFVNTIVIRTDWSDDPTFSDLVRRNKSRFLDAVEHSQVPFDVLVNELAPDRDLSTPPLAQVMFSYGDGDPDGIALPGVEAARIPTLSENSKLDLTLQIDSEADGTMSGALEYSTTLFEPDTVRRFADNLFQLLESATSSPDRPLSDLQYITEQELGKLLAAADGGTADRPGGALHELIAEQARISPDAPAVLAGDTSLTFGELDAEANRLAQHLRSRGVEPGSVVGVHLPRDARLVVALLAVLKAGAAYAPLDPGDSATRRGYILSDAGAQVVVTDGPGADALAHGLDGHTVVLVDRDAEVIGAQTTEDPGLPIARDALAYLIYTSGTTGLPKGVMVAHGGLMNYLWWTVDTYLQAPGGTALFSSAAFDLGVPNLYTSLLSGRPVHLVPDGEPAELGTRLLACGPLSFVKMAPGHLELLAEQLDPDQRRSLAGLVIAAGDRFTSTLANSWLADAGPGSVAAEYGPTEITVGNSGCRVDRPVDTELVSIGTAIPNTTMYVLDERMRPVPFGVVGEVYIGGTGVTRGYLNKPHLTAEKYLPDPFSAEQGARLYRTGDLVALRSNGDVDFVGRVDKQVKIRGYRVEPAEVESTMAAHPAVRTALVVARQTDGGRPELVGYVVPTAGTAAPDQATLRAFVSERLPEYMVPSAIVVLDSLPLTDVGKIDTDALPAPDRASRGVSADLVSPRSDAEAEIAAVWRTVLGASDFGVHDNFFVIGGDSVRAVAVVGALRRKGYPVTVRDVFEHRTIEAFARILGPRSAHSVDAPVVQPFAMLDPADRARIPDGVTDAYPLSRIQLGMILEMESSGNEGNYHNVTCYLVRDGRPYRHDLLQAAIDATVARHEVLRTTMDLTTYSEPLQLVHSEAHLPVGFADVRQMTPEAQRNEVHDYMAAERGRRFDMSTAPLFRYFTHMCEDQWWVTFTEFHPILEGWSFHVLLSEVFDRYHALHDGTEYVPKPLPQIRYADFIALERKDLQDPAHAGYWHDVVANHAKLELPSAWGGGSGPVKQLVTPYDDLLDELAKLARAADASLKNVMLAAHLSVMSMITTDQAFSTGLVCDTRPEAEGADRVPGLYVNTVPFPFRRGARTWRQLVQQVRDTEIEMWPHRRYPLGEIQEGSRHARMIDVAFVYLDFHVLDWDLIDDDAVVDDSPNEFRLMAVAQTGRLTVYSRPGDAGPHAQALLGTLYRAVLEAMAADVDGDTQQVLTPRTYRSIAYGPESTVALGERAPAPITIPDEEMSVHGLVERQVDRAPDAVAVVCGKDELTYKELNARANRLARRLAAAGIGTEAVVAVHLERSVDLVVAYLAVLKSGGVVLPVDPEYPRDWRRTLLAQAEPDALVTEEAWLSDFGDIRIPAICLDADPGLLIQGADANVPGTWSGGDQLAYVIYTSGSTGRPKGVENTHRGLLNTLKWGQQRIPLGPDDAVLQMVPISFDVSLWEIFRPLTVGSRLVLAQPGGHRDMHYLADLVADQQITVIHPVPSILAIFLDTPEVARRCSSLRHIVPAGEALPIELQQRAMRELPWIRLHNHYGPAETAIIATAWECRADDGCTTVPIGRPIGRSWALICDSDLNPVPTGAVGELCLAGDLMGRGYHAAPALTADRFVPAPMGLPGERMYRTGDLARMAPDGVIEFLGRIDRQVKLHGVRIEPGQIESVLVKHAAIRDAVVVVDGTGGGKRLLAYVVPDAVAATPVRRQLLDASAGAAPEPQGMTADGTWSNAEALVADVRRWCQEQLPPALVPSAVILMAAFPLSHNGKLDQAALPAPSAVPAGLQSAPRSRTELDLLHIWERILQTRGIGIEDDFFEVGGNSLLGVRLISTIRKELGIDLPMASLLNASTVAAQAASLVARRPRQLRTLVPLRLGTGRPTFCVAPVGGTAFCYLDLARSLPGDGPVHGLQSVGIEPGEHPLTSVADIAAAHLALVREAQPEGPLRLIGWSFGGLVAYEMARQCAENGEEVELLAMIDPALPPSLLPHPPGAVDASEEEPEVIAAYLTFLDRLHEVDMALDAEKLTAMPSVERRQELVTRMRDAQLIPTDATTGEELRLFEVFSANWRALRDYRPQPYPGRTLIFSAGEAAEDERAAAARRQWLSLCTGDTTALSLAGDHYAAVKAPNTATVARSVAVS